MSTRFCSRNGSRLAETASTNSMSSSAMPSFAAMILAISTSKPSGSPDRPLRPNSGWSNFVPTVILPASASSAMRLPASKLGRGLGLAGRGGVVAVVVVAAGREREGEGRREGDG